MTDLNSSGNAGNRGRAGVKQKKPTSLYRKIRRKFAKTPFRAPLVWMNHRGLCPADVFTASYPKSGVTWTRFVLFEVLSGMPSGFKSTNQLMTGIGKHTKGLRLLPGGGRLIGTHEQYRKNYKRAIYLVRDARDVVSSEFAFLTALEYFHGSLDDYISTFLLTCGSAYGYGPWQRHVDSWLDSPLAGTDNMLLVRYEDLRQDPLPWFTRMVDFLGVKVEKDRLQQAIENNSIQKMREKEMKEPVRVSIKGRFVRDGAVRGWVDRLTPAQVRLIEKHAGSALLRLGYPLSSELGGVSGAAMMAHAPDTALRV
ncbi:MAG TPA: sulfotransferase domain-containing protein [Terriglobia bacterium]|nr:sulfotransferase domain-containing protein [Terriglobia bacterium]